MKLRAITLENVRRFTAPVRVADIGDGLNVLSEPNEHGKSTLFDAIQALFFKPHGSRDRDITALRPHAGGAPCVTVEVETGDGVFAISKQWLSKPSATVTRNGNLVAQADQAEAWIADRLGGGAGDPSGLVWVRQGMTGLTLASKKEEESALEARRDLLSSVTGEVEAMTGGQRMDNALRRCEAELDVYATSTGRPKANGPWKDAQDNVARLQEDHRNLTATAEALHEALDRRRRAQRALRELEDPEAVAARAARLEAATAAHRAAERHGAQVDDATRARDAARLTLSATQDTLDRFRAALADRAEAQTQFDAADQAATAAKAAYEKARARAVEAGTALETAKAAETQADATARKARQQQAARDGAARRTELASRIAKAQDLRVQMETESAAAKTGPDAAALRDLEAKAQAVVVAEAARAAQAPQVTVTYDSGAEGRVSRDGVALDYATPLAIVGPTTLTLDGIGSLDIQPGAAMGDEASVETARRALQQALDARALPDLDAARKAAEARAEATRRHGEAAAVFASLAPDGLEALQAALAAIPEAAEDDDTPDTATADAALAQAAEARVAAQSARDAANEALSDARAEATRTDTARTAAADRLRRAKEALAKHGDATDEALTATRAAAAAALEQAEATLDERRRAAPDLDAAAATLARAQSVDAQARADIARLKPEIATFDERINAGSGNAVEERLAETAEQLEAARAQLDRIEREVAVLTLLKQVLETAWTEARERYFAPIAKELQPLLHILWPEAELQWADETLLPEALTRDGQEEKLNILSGGTQEQIALLVRLAFARMLARGGRHAPVILDDALVFTDDDRIERMFDALHRQAGDLQIIVLTCRQRAFRDLGGRTLTLAPAE